MKKTIERPAIDGDKLYAFWRDSSFPYVLGGIITRMAEDGAVETVGFGRGHFFMPFRIVTASVGLKLSEALGKLRNEKRAAEAAFTEEWDAKLEALFPEAVEHPTIQRLKERERKVKP